MTQTGPNPNPGGEQQPGGPVPPYEGRTTGTETPTGEARAERVEEQLAETKTGQPGETETPAEEQPVHPDAVTDEEPDSPAGVGKSTNRSGEDIVEDESKEAGRKDVGTQGESERPVGVSDERDTTGVDP
jgi:hypothetical protein